MAGKKKEKWLILAHCFNMDGRAASQTITDRLPLFMKAGMVPVVVSAPTGSLDQRFPHRQVFSPAPSGILFELRHIIKRDVKSPVNQQILKAFLTLVCLPFYIPEKIFIHLDSHWSWFLSATLTALRLIKEHRPVLIYSTAGPSSTHLAGYLLHRITGLPWLVELHDPLVIESQPEKGQRGAFNRWLEKTVSRHAAAVLFFTDKALANACKRQPALQNKGYVIRPGASPPDFSSVSYMKRDRIHFGHFGSLSSTRTLSTVIQALYELLEQYPEWSQYISLDIYGIELDAVSESTLKSYPLPGVLQRFGRLEYNPQTKKSGRQQVLEAMRLSDVLIVVHGTGDVCAEYIPSKLYEYLLTHRPILGLADPGSELADILTADQHCYCVPQKLEKVKEILAVIIRVWLAEGLPDRPGDTPFTIEATVEKILSISEKIQQSANTT